MCRLCVKCVLGVCFITRCTRHGFCVRALFTCACVRTTTYFPSHPRHTTRSPILRHTPPFTHTLHHTTSPHTAQHTAHCTYHHRGAHSETMGFLNGIIIPKTFTLKVLLSKLLSCIMAVGSGIPAGPEGPMIHMGSVAGSLVSQVGSSCIVVWHLAVCLVCAVREALEVVMCGRSVSCVVHVKVEMPLRATYRLRMDACIDVRGRAIVVLRMCQPLRVGTCASLESMGLCVKSTRACMCVKGQFMPKSITKFIAQFRDVGNRRDFMSAGVAGGVAAAFGAPVVCISRLCLLTCPLVVGSGKQCWFRVYGL